MKPVGNASFGCKEYHFVHHVSAASHYKTHVVIVFQHFGGGFHEVFGTFLHCYSSKERDDFFFGFGYFEVEQVFAQRCHGIVYRGYFGRVDAVFFNNGLSSKVADGHDMVGVVHAVLLYAEYGGIDIAARAVEVGGVHVDYEGFACNLLGVYAGRVCEPVVGVDYVEIKGAGYHAGAY